MKTLAPSLFASFWSRALGFITDIFMIGLPISLIISALFGYDQTHSATAIDIITSNQKALANPPNPIASTLQILLFMSITVMLWRYSGQTPGKKLARIAVVDANTLKPAPYWKLILRFIAYLVSAISMVGFFIGLFRKDNRALHDLLSNTCVINKH